MEPVLVEGFGVEIDPEEITRLLGRGSGAPGAAAGRLERVIDEMLSRAGELIAPRGIYTVTPGSGLLGSTHFEGLERVAFCICTIGGGLEREVSELSAGDELLRAVVLDSAGSVAAEETAGYMERRIRDEAACEGLRISCRASPGYGDWDIEEQRAIFKLLPGERIGVRLSKSCMMIPRKSISFAVHVAEDPVRLRGENSCAECDVEDCPYRPPG